LLHAATPRRVDKHSVVARGTRSSSSGSCRDLRRLALTKKAPARATDAGASRTTRGKRGQSSLSHKPNAGGPWQFRRTSIPLRASGAPPFQENPRNARLPDFKIVGLKPAEAIETLARVVNVPGRQWSSWILLGPLRHRGPWVLLTRPFALEAPPRRSRGPWCAVRSRVAPGRPARNGADYTPTG
jgi:hypothetical protein